MRVHSSDESARELLDDARLLGMHLVRTGALPIGSKLFQEAHQVSTHIKDGQTPNLSALSHEVDRAVRAIKPTTLAQLRQMGLPRSKGSKLVGYLTPLALAALTLTLTLYLAFQSSELHKAEVALNEYQ